jgi:hypothetical protein
MNAAAPEGTPSRRINDQYRKNNVAVPCLGEALRWGTSPWATYPQECLPWLVAPPTYPVFS